MYAVELTTVEYPDVIGYGTCIALGKTTNVSIHG